MKPLAESERCRTSLFKNNFNGKVGNLEGMWKMGLAQGCEMGIVSNFRSEPNVEICLWYRVRHK